MNQLLSLDSHFLFFDEAEKESFDIDSFLSPAYDMAVFPPMVDHEAVLSTPYSSPSKMNNESHQNENSLFMDEEDTGPKQSEKKSLKI